MNTRSAAHSSLRDAQKELAHARLLEAALASFEEKGYAATTIEDIAAGAGASRGTFYVHFHGKADVVRELFLTQSQGWVTEYERLFALGASPSWRDLRGFVARLTAYWEENSDLADVLSEAVYVDPEQIAAAWSEGLASLISVVVRYLASRGIDEETARLRATLLIAQMNRFSFFRRLPGMAFDDEAVVDELTDTWWHALLPPSAVPRDSQPDGA